jgi:hypothetical protein
MINQRGNVLGAEAMFARAGHAVDLKQKWHVGVAKVNDSTNWKP